ncbi:LCP family protein [Kutzneria viridogrisea]|uniref:LCP family protein required for cell wall assembly n=1 Tax=Kutzneria viridogrisea TaxID=47990 RepID=A0ABR6BIM9_9PSEU|nr:LCP family protein required for cell wall assembly [Kutzneria viridogrisea]
MAEQEPTEGEPPARSSARGGQAARLGLGAGRTLVALASVAVLAMSTYGWAELQKVRSGTTTTDVIESKPAPTSAQPHSTGLDGPVDILIVGLDSRTDAQGNPLPQEVLDQLHAGSNDGELNTDTMIVLHIPADGRSAVAFSFPRDSYVEIAGDYGKHKLNSAYAYARNDTRQTLAAKGVTGADLDEQAAVAGRKNLIRTIERLTGGAVSINRYAEVNLASFYQISQAVGGVPICLNTAVREEKSGINLPAGQQTVSGAQALSFVRQRYDLPRGDLDRIVRQQAFLAGLVQKVLSADTLTSPSKLNALIEAVNHSVVLSQGWDMLNFVQQLQGIAGGSVRFQTIPTGQNVMIGGQSVTLVDPESVHQFVSGLTGEGARPTTTGSADPANGRITVDVRDGSGAPNLAQSVFDELTSAGFTRGEAIPVAAMARSVLRYPAGGRADAEKVLAPLGGKVALEQDTSVPAGHVRFYLGTDYSGPGSQGFGAGGLKYVLQPPSPTTATTTPTGEPTITAGGVPCVN